MMDASNYSYFTRRTFNNANEGGIIKAREVLNGLKDTNKPFLQKHPEYEEDYSFSVKELTTELIYQVRKIKDGSEENRGDI